MSLRVETTIDASPEAVWAHLEDVASHVEWMADAVAIEFLTDRRQGTGTRFACLTQVWVFRTTDIMEITEWSPPRVMGVRHAGAVSGDGRFELHPTDPAARSAEPGRSDKPDRSAEPDHSDQPGQPGGTDEPGHSDQPGQPARSDEPGGSTTMTWTERLYFPWWMGGPLGATLARPVLRRIWRTNLARLKTLVEAAPRH